MLDWLVLVFASMLTVRAARAARNRIVLAPSSAALAAGDVLVVACSSDSTGGPESADPGELARVVVRVGDEGALLAGRSERWFLFTRRAVAVDPALIAAAVRLADERSAHAVSIHGGARSRSPWREGISATLAQWSGDGVDPVEFAGPRDRRAAGWDDFLLVQREAYERVGGHAQIGSDPLRARALVRALKRAGRVVLLASAASGLDSPERSWAERIEEGVARYHGFVPHGRLAATWIALLITVVGVRPFVLLAHELVKTSPPTAHPVLVGLTCALLVAHRLAFHRLTASSPRAAWTLPLGLVVCAGTAWVAAVQRALGLDVRFRRAAPDPVPDHSQGVDYKAVYTERYFDGVDSHFSPCGHRDEASYYERLLEPILAERQGGRALDVGCGYGYLTRRLARHFEVEGMDVSDAAVRHARELSPSISFTVHEIEQPFPMPDGSFDLVTLTDVLEHVVEPQRVLANVHRVLADDGLLYVTTPNLNRLRRWLYAEADRREHHVSLMARSELLRLLERSGFRVRRSWTYVSAYLIPGRFRSDLGPETGVICEKVVNR